MSKRYTAEWVAKIVATRRERDNYKISDEHRQKLSQANLGRKPTSETKEKIRLIRTGRPTSLVGRKYTAIHRKRIAEGHTGLHHVEDTLIKIANRPNPCKGKDNPRTKLTESQALEIFQSYSPGAVTIKELSQHYNISMGAIVNIIYGYAWNHVTGLPIKGRKYKK